MEKTKENPKEISEIIRVARRIIDGHYSEDKVKCSEALKLVNEGLAELSKEKPDPTEPYRWHRDLQGFLGGHVIPGGSLFRLSDLQPAVPSEYASNFRILIIMKKVTEDVGKAEPKDERHELWDAKWKVEKYEKQLDYITDIYRNHIEAPLDVLQGMDGMLYGHADAEPFKTHRQRCWEITNEAAGEFRRMANEFAGEFGMSADEMFAEEYYALKYIDSPLLGIDKRKKELQPTDKGTHVAKVTEERIEKKTEESKGS